MLPELFTHFHFLRPEWLLALLPVVLILLWLRFEKAAQGDWHNIIPEHLLKHLIHEKPGASSKPALLLLALIWLLSVFAMSGPTWTKLAQPVYEKLEARIYVLDLSFSMYASDIKPDRITRARLKLMDLLQNKREGLSALVVFSGDAHVVTPLTNDTKTIISLVNSLEPKIMPDAGNNVTAGIQKALALLSNTKIDKGEIILLSDEVSPNHIAAINSMMSQSPFSLSIMGVGTTEGAPIKLPNGQFFKHENQIIVPKLNRSEMQSLAENNGGQYVDIQHNDSDIQALLSSKLNQQNEAKEREQQFDIWFDAGQWLMLPILALAAFSFRKGWILILPLTLTLSLGFPNKPIYAQTPNQENQEAVENESKTSVIKNTISSWFLTGDQRGLQNFKNQNFQEAAKNFNHQDWKASSLFYSGQFAQASELFKADNSETSDKQSSSWYNKANALAFTGDLNKSIEAFEKALELNPENEDAAFNKALVEKLKDMQEQQQQNQNQDQSQNSEQQKQKEGQEQQGDNQQNKQEGSKDSTQDTDDSEQADGSQQDAEGSQQESDQNNSEENSEQDNSGSEQNENQEAENSEKETAESDETAQNAEQEAPSAEEAAMSPEEAAMSPEETAMSAEQEALSAEQREEQQALEQWLRQVPDDPSGLLRRKFQLEYRRNQKQHSEEQQLW